MTEPDLIAEVVAGTPHLHGALCAGESELFDPSTPDDNDTDRVERIAFAVKVCRHCPELAACQSWLDGLPACQRPTGVIAGRINLSQPPGRPKVAE